MAGTAGTVWNKWPIFDGAGFSEFDQLSLISGGSQLTVAMAYLLIPNLVRFRKGTSNHLS